MTTSTYSSSIQFSGTCDSANATSISDGSCGIALRNVSANNVTIEEMQLRLDSVSEKLQNSEKLVREYECIITKFQLENAKRNLSIKNAIQRFGEVTSMLGMYWHHFSLKRK